MHAINNANFSQTSIQSADLRVSAGYLLKTNIEFKGIQITHQPEAVRRMDKPNCFNQLDQLLSTQGIADFQNQQTKGSLGCDHVTNCISN